ncbi:hypothetical protein AC579_10163 [Pseudocercospora musae]|uniref:Uncharacterized protein n=1 Tax=Pseudocercospora musae TaxID=113226 RepID=A0A139IS92_9PEZI|nr:hypothetical protein AC579_10163 [Pseudocercospora musae]
MDPSSTIDNRKIASTVLERILPGVVVATKAPEYHHIIVSRWLAEHTASRESQKCSLIAWEDSINARLSGTGPRHLASLTLAVSFMVSADYVEATTLDYVWSLIQDAITDLTMAGVGYTPSRSAQGFLSLPLCSIIKDGNIDILFRLHVWMPDGQRGKPEVAIHSHQAFARSWTLHGEGTDVLYAVKPVVEYEEATHCAYAIGWNDGKSQSSKYATHQLSSMVVNTGKLMQAKHQASTIHRRGDTYTVPAAAYHTTVVQPQGLHATLFFFDASRGFVKDAGVLGPKDWSENTQLRDPAGITSSDLVELVSRARASKERIEVVQPETVSEPELVEACPPRRIDSLQRDASDVQVTQA